jgi:hypothetical protein
VPKIIKQEVLDWVGEPMTIEFFERVKLHIVDADANVHRALEEVQYEQAALHNAGMVQLEEVMDIPQRMINEDDEDE